MSAAETARRTPGPAAVALGTAALLLSMQAETSAQHLSSARGLGLGAYTAAADDLGALDWNPAGLASVRDWELSAASFLQLRSGEGAGAFHHAALGKRFLPGHAAAIRYSPGMRLEFVVPSTFTVEDSGSSIMTQFDRTISYEEQFALGYAFRPGAGISLGFGAHFLEERVDDAAYSIDTNNVISSTPVRYAGNSWTLDWGAAWDPFPGLRVGAVAKNLVRITESSLPAEADAPSLSLPKAVRAGAAWSAARNVLLAAEAGSDERLRAGAEWTPLEALSLATGTHLKWAEGSGVEAVTAGATARLGTVTASAGVLLFADQAGRGGSAGLPAFRASGIEAIEENAFTGNRAVFTVSVDLGRARDPIARIEYVEMLSDIYPASSAVYAFRPVGRARVRNVTDAPIDATVGFRIDGFTDARTESRPQRIPPGETAEIPFFAVLNAAVQGVRSMTVGEGEVSVTAVRSEGAEDRYPARVLVRGKNDWNGDATLLKYFLTPGDPAILSATRAALGASAAAADSADPRLRNFFRARTLFDALSGRLLYVHDPRGSQDHVQYPSETLDLRGGDCDDLTVLFCSMLSSIGIRTAFVDVVPPEAPDSAHIYLMFDTGIPAGEAGLLSDNPKRYVVRGAQSGPPTVWVPLEPTLTRKGFDAAWEDAANQYYRSVEVGMGLARGWVRIVDHETEF